MINEKGLASLNNTEILSLMIIFAIVLALIILLIKIICNSYELNIKVCVICGNKSKYIIKDTTKEYSICKECKNKYSVVSAQDVRRVKNFFEMNKDE